MKTSRILIIEDEPALAAALATVCQRMDCGTVLCHSGQRGLEELAAGEFALVVLDIGLPDMNGLELLKKLRNDAAKLPVLIITAHGNLANAVMAKQLGANAYLVKPLDLTQLRGTLQELLAVRTTTAVRAESSSSLLIGAAPAMQRVFVEIAHACVTDAPVLLTGPTGTGKTLVARNIHINSMRRAAPFVSLHCTSLPEPLLESELFGHEKNAFTGAPAMRPGHLERARGGTLFLDEIGDISLATQSKLLRFVEEKTFTRVGGREDIRMDLRLSTATNRDLREAVRAGRFREDLYYRLHVLEIEMPALRTRKEDIPVLSALFLGGAAQLSPEAQQVLEQYDWPGNVRELRNALERAVATCSGGMVYPSHLPRDIREHRPRADTGVLEQAVESWLAPKLVQGETYDQIHDELEALVLRSLLKHFGNKPTALAHTLQMNRATLLKKRLRMGLG